MKVAVLFSGNASSVYCHHLVREAGVDVGYLVTPKAPSGSRPRTSLDPGLAGISARSLGFPLIEFDADDEDDTSPLIEVLAGLDIDGLCDGALRSNLRRNRLLDVCRKLDIQLVLPLWHKDPAGLLSNMIEEGFEIMVAPRTDRLDENWHGRVLDLENLEEFVRACDELGMDPMGEFGEFGLAVLSGPNMQERIEVSTALLSHQIP